jgi:hypothetical protein
MIFASTVEHLTDSYTTTGAFRMPTLSGNPRLPSPKEEDSEEDSEEDFLVFNEYYRGTQGACVKASARHSPDESDDDAMMLFICSQCTLSLCPFI